MGFIIYFVNHIKIQAEDSVLKISQKLVLIRGLRIDCKQIGGGTHILILLKNLSLINALICLLKKYLFNVALTTEIMK